MQNNRLSDVKSKELVAAGHAFAKAMGMDTPLIEIAKMVSELAGRLDVALVRGDELQQKLDALGHENATIKTMNDVLSEELRGYESDGAYDGPVAHKLWHSNSETPATDAYLNSVRAEAVVEAASRIAAQVWEEDEGAGMVAAIGALAIIERELRAGQEAK